MNKKIGPWTQISSEIVYENPWIKISHEKVLNPKGGDGIYGKIHFKNVAIGIVPLFADGHIMLVGQHRYPHNKYSWEIPEGGCPLNETPERGARRELLEETGLSCEVLSEIGRFDVSNSVSDESAIIFLATGLSQGQAQPEDTEELVRKKIALADAIAMVHRGEITDSLSIIALQKLEILILRNELSI